MDCTLQMEITYLHNAITHLNIVFVCCFGKSVSRVLNGLEAHPSSGGVVPPLGCGRASFGGIRRGFPRPVN